MAILGAAAFWGSTPEETAAAFDRALAVGVNHLDIAPQYGKAQELVGPLVPAVRDRLFVGCKTLRKQPRRGAGPARGVARRCSAATHSTSTSCTP